MENDLVIDYDNNTIFIKNATNEVPLLETIDDISDNNKLENKNNSESSSPTNSNKNKDQLVSESSSNSITSQNNEIEVKNIKPKKKFIVKKISNHSPMNLNNRRRIPQKSKIIRRMISLNQITNYDNGWDDNANETIKNWYNTFRYDSFVYQFTLDRNIEISDKLSIVSIVSSSTLGIFSGFKLWITSDIFQTVSNVLLVLFNFAIALITATSKRYIDDKRNETIRSHIAEIDKFLGEISAQVLKTPNYRMDADKFFILNNDRYTNIITQAPNLSIDEIKRGKEAYTLYMNERE